MNIAIVEDHLLLANALEGLLGKDNEVKIFTTAEAFIAHNFNAWQPDLVLTDIVLGGMDGVDMMVLLLPKLKERTKFILMSSITDIYTVKSAMRKSANGYISKEASLEEMMECIQVVMEGGKYISKALKDDLFQHMLEEEDEVVLHLTPKEKEVLRRVCNGQTPKEIAYDLQLSLHTIQYYNQRLMRKFKVNRSTDMVVFAIKKGLFKDGS